MEPRQRAAESLWEETPPADLTAERAVVSCLALSAGYWGSVTTKILSELTEADFSDHAARELFATVKRAVDKRVQLKRKGLLGWIKKDRLLDRVKAADLADLWATWWIRGLLEHYVARVKEHARQRRAIATAWELVPRAYAADPQTWAREAMRAAMDLLGEV
jgi:replicative DNA helicase